MKRVYLLLAVVLLCGMMSAQQSGMAKRSTVVADEKLPIKFNVRAGMNVDYNYYSGFGGNIAGSVEIPLSKRYEGWKMNVGVKFINTNLFMPTSTMSSLFLRVPVIFSYDFNIRPDVDLRLGFGAFYSYHAGGAVHNRDMVIWDGNMFLPHNGGANVGLGFYFRDFFFGVDYDMSVEYDSGWFSSVSASFGYRF